MKIIIDTNKECITVMEGDEPPIKCSFALLQSYFDLARFLAIIRLLVKYTKNK